MRVVLMVDAVPGYERAVRDALLKVDAIEAVTYSKAGNLDLAVQVDVPDRAALSELVHSTLRSVLGVAGVREVRSPEPQVLSALRLGRALPEPCRDLGP